MITLPGRLQRLVGTNATTEVYQNQYDSGLQGPAGGSRWLKGVFVRKAAALKSTSYVRDEANGYFQGWVLLEVTHTALKQAVADTLWAPTRLHLYAREYQICPQRLEAHLKQAVNMVFKARILFRMIFRCTCMRATYVLGKETGHGSLEGKRGRAALRRPTNK
jgi:hypothetical protein